ncbi:MAG: hypothetical protein NXI09_10795 [Bacteroidetes bacterium]|nr:hypothetical protein [Bacteroidota bacterium]
MKLLGTLIILISVAILIHLIYISPTIIEEAPKMWKAYQADPDEFNMKGHMDTLLYWVLHLVIPAILIGTGRALRRGGR